MISRAAATDDVELSHQLRLSAAKLVITDAERLPLVKKATQEVGLPRESIYLLEGDGEVPSIADLSKFGELQWDRLDRLEDVARRLAHQVFGLGICGF